MSITSAVSARRRAHLPRTSAPKSIDVVVDGGEGTLEAAFVPIATGPPAEDVAEDMRRGRYLDAREALEYTELRG